MARAKEGLLVVAVMLSLLCTAIMHQSLLEAKAVRMEQSFPRDPRLSAGMTRRKSRLREDRTDGPAPPWPGLFTKRWNNCKGQRSKLNLALVPMSNLNLNLKLVSSYLKLL